MSINMKNRECILRLQDEILEQERLVSSLKDELTELKTDINLSTANERKKAVNFLMKHFKFSNRRACDLIRLGRNTLRYESKKKESARNKR